MISVALGIVLLVLSIVVLASGLSGLLTRRD
jgi:hypothetical protein